MIAALLRNLFRKETVTALPDYTVDQLYSDMTAFIAAERGSNYSNEELESLWDMAIGLRRNMEGSMFADDIPFDLWRVLGNVDFGATGRDYRTWVLEDAEKALSVFRAEQQGKDETGHADPAE
ncbi:MAG: hypothetical protein R3C04_00365 [Hyphomonas sp.]